LNGDSYSDRFERQILETQQEIMYLKDSFYISVLTDKSNLI